MITQESKKEKTFGEFSYAIKKLNYDHVSHRFVKGFTMLILGWSDGYSFVPVAFNLLSSAEKSNRYNESSTQMDKRTNGYKLMSSLPWKK